MEFADPSVSDRVPSHASASEERAATQRALASLSDDTRALLLQRHGLDMKLSELAESWDVTERTIRNRLHGAVRELTLALIQPTTETGGSQ